MIGSLIFLFDVFYSLVHYLWKNNTSKLDNLPSQRLYYGSKFLSFAPVHGCTHDYDKILLLQLLKFDAQNATLML